MKKNVMKIAFMAAFAVIAGYGVSNSQQTEVMSDLMAANVEALAGISRGVNIPCIEAEGTCEFLFTDANGKNHNGYIEGMDEPE